MSTKNSSEDNYKIIKIVITSLVIGCLGIILYISQSKTLQEAISIFGIALMISGASLLSGGFLGFLFGIPRSLQQNEGSDESTKNINKDRERDVTYGANTNLEQISDWLTKILVGVGLTQISSMPKAFQNYAIYASAGLGNFRGTEAFALALLVYFLIGGFLLGYLWTRLSLASALRQADIAALGGEIAKVKDKLSSLEEQNAIDGKAINFIQEFLNSSSELTFNTKYNDKETQKSINEIITPTSPVIKEQIFNIAHEARKENLHKNNKSAMEKTIPVFRALILTDPEKSFHRYRAQLGYALKDKINPVLEDFIEAEARLTEAIEIRGSGRENGYLYYELNRAVCGINLDIKFSKGDKQRILSDIKEASKEPYVRQIIKKDKFINNWLAKKR